MRNYVVRDDEKALLFDIEFGRTVCFVEVMEDPYLVQQHTWYTHYGRRRDLLHSEAAYTVYKLSEWERNKATFDDVFGFDASAHKNELREIHSCYLSLGEMEDDRNGFYGYSWRDKNMHSFANFVKMIKQLPDIEIVFDGPDLLRFKTPKAGGRFFSVYQGLDYEADDVVRAIVFKQTPHDADFAEKKAEAILWGPHMQEQEEEYSLSGKTILSLYGKNKK